MQAHIQAVWAGLTSWVVGLMMLLGTYSDSIIKVLGFVLVAARLAQEIPKVYEMYIKRKSKRRLDDD